MSELRPGERIGGRYILEDRLGLGGMGEVWLADMEGAGAFRRHVVLKVLAPERRGDERLASMLADEARVVGMLHHPAILAAIDYLETEEWGPVFVIDYVDGASLRTVLKLARANGACLPQELAAHIGTQVAHALHAAHTAVGRDGQPLGVVHRDVAPDNVLLSRSGAVYLGDFGVARASGNTDVTQPGTGPKGKLGYMAPEQALGKPVGPQADIFSLGRVVSEAADVNCGPALREVLSRATAEKPRDRYSSASEMASALVRACPPPSDADRELARWMGEHVPDALVWRQTSPGSTPPRFDTPPPGKPVARPRAASTPPPAKMFAAVPPPPRRMWKVLGAIGAVAVLAALALVWSARRGIRTPFQSVIGAPASAHGELRVTSRPSEAEVYVDGTLRGLTPLRVQLPAGKHSVRVGSPRLEHWRAAEVLVKDNVEHDLDIDLSE